MVTYDVTIKLDNQGHLLKPDMTATVTITTGSQTNVLLVPSVAIQVGVEELESQRVNDRERSREREIRDRKDRRYRWPQHGDY